MIERERERLEWFIMISRGYTGDLYPCWCRRQSHLRIKLGSGATRQVGHVCTCGGDGEITRCVPIKLSVYLGRDLFLSLWPAIATEANLRPRLEGLCLVVVEIIKYWPLIG